VERLLDARPLVLEVEQMRACPGAAEPSCDGCAANLDVLAAARTSVAPGAPLSERAAAAMDAVRRIVRALRSADGRSERELGLTVAQHFVLRQLASCDAMTIGELSRRTVTSQGSVSEVVSRLAARGLVRRGASASDRRRAALSLTEDGRALVERGAETVQERMVAGFRRLPAAQQEALASGLAAWLDEASLGELSPSMFFEPLADRP
jgi:DNA-binding MarR family transcriptional regulator